MDIAEKVVTLVLFIIIDYYLIRTMIKGAPFAPTPPQAIARMLKLARVQPGEVAADLGSGDGRIVLAFAREGAIAHGYELNPLLVWYSRWKIRRAGLRGRAFIHRKNYWKEDFGRYGVVAVFGVPNIMKPLEEKLRKELAPGARAISNYFQFPTWKNTASEDKVFLYRQDHDEARAQAAV